jgi:SWI/SNF-related matrix-associated actin-dependent regulator 1 of chromatin subfamily A
MILHHTIDSGQTEWAPWVHAKDDVYWCESSFEEKEICKGAGFSFHGKKDDNGKWVGKRVWWTSDKDKAAKLAEFAETPQEQWAKDLAYLKTHSEKSLVGSRQSVSYTEFPHPEGIDYYPFQKAGIEYITARTNTLLADDMGLGKTIQVLGLINLDETIKTVLVICPKTICLNWMREAEKWLIRPMQIAIATPKYVPMPADGYNFIITNYETVGKANRKLTSITWDLLCIDEAHYLKNIKTLRYRSIMGGNDREDVAQRYNRIEAKRRVFCTGTPICNYPAELWPLISAVDPEKWNKKTFWYYHKRFCNVQQSRYGVDFTGAASPERLNELQELLRSRCMIRRLKAEVLTELPPKVRQVIELEYDENDMSVRKALAHEKEYQDRINDDEQIAELSARAEMAKASENDDEYRTAIEAISKAHAFAFEEIARIRRETAEAKVPYALDYIREQLESVPKMVVFAHHHVVIEAFAKAFPVESVSIYGEVSVEDRHKAIDKFQTDPACRLALVSIKAGGLGITLTAASHVFFVELDWVPGNVTQAEDRCHRIGQTDIVNVYHLVLADSLDVQMARTIIAKQKVIEAALDKMMGREPVMPTKDHSATKTATRKQITEEAEKLTAEEIIQIHADLKSLAGADSDYAHGRNSMGFNKIDTYIGHELAAAGCLSRRQAALGKRILRKYKRQLQEA